MTCPIPPALIGSEIPGPAEGTAPCAAGPKDRRRKRRAPKGASPLFLLLALFVGGLVMQPSQAQAQSAQEILSQAMERYEANLAGVDNITVRQEVMGFETLSYMEKGLVDGHSVLQPREVETGGDFDPVEETGDLWASPHELYVALADRWTLEGRGSVGGRETWVLSLTDTQDVDWDLGAGPDDGFVPDEIQLELDVDELYPLAMRISGQAAPTGDAAPFAVRLLFDDYRAVSGYLHPFVIRMETEGGAPGISDAELEEARQGLAELERELEAMPEAQRAMMQEMMGDQLEMLEEIVAGGGIEMEVRVIDLQVNAGPPSR